MSSSDIRLDVRAFVEALNATPAAHLERLTPGQARLLMTNLRASTPAMAEDRIALIRDLTAPGPAGPLKLRLYDLRSAREPSPIMVFFHGGGFVLGDLDSHHEVCIEIARVIDIPVVAVDYRLAPEAKFPAAFEDALAMSRWIAANASEALGRKARGLVLAGDSAGANLAAATARKLMDHPSDIPVLLQFLIYPTNGAGQSTRSKQLFAEGLFLTKENIAWFEDHYGAARGDPRYDLLAFDQSGMPPSLLVTAGLDPLRDEGRDYAARLVQAGVEVCFQEAVGNIHGFFGFTAAIPSAVADVSRALTTLRVMVESL